MTLREILARRDAVRTELSGILTEYATGVMPEPMEARASDLEAEAARLNDAERRAVLIDEMARSALGRPLDGSSTRSKLEVRAFDSGPTPEPEGFDGTILRTQDGARVPLLEYRHRLASFLPASESRAVELGLGGLLRALYHGPQTELEKRVMAEASAGAGGVLVPTPLSAEVFDLLRTKSVAFSAGCRMVPMASQTLKFARLTADPVGGWRAENAAIAVSDPTFDSVTLTAKSWALIVKVSRELLEDAMNLDAQLRSVFARVAALALDAAILYGTGTSNMPLGIANTSGINVISMGTNGAAYSGWAVVLDAVLTLENANAGAVSAMILAPRTARAVAGGVDASGQPLQPPPRVAGIPILSTTGMPITETQGSSSVASSVLLGDFSTVLVGLRTQLQVSVLTERFADNGQIGYVLWMRGDVGVAHPQALARIQGITP